MKTEEPQKLESIYKLQFTEPGHVLELYRKVVCYKYTIPSRNFHIKSSLWVLLVFKGALSSPEVEFQALRQRRASPATEKNCKSSHFLAQIEYLHFKDNQTIVTLLQSKTIIHQFTNFYCQI